MPKSLPALLALLMLASFGESLLAQPTSTVSVRPNRAAPGVKLSETTTFRNVEQVAYDILPYGDDFFVSTHVLNRSPVAALGAGARFDDLYALRLYRYTPDLKRTGEISIAWPDERREHIGIVSLGNALLWTFATISDKRGEIEVHAEVLNDKGEPMSEHRLLNVESRDYFFLGDFEAYSANRDYYVRAYADESPQRLLRKTDDERATITVAVFNRDGEVVTMERKRVRANRDQLDIQTVAVDDDGRAYVLAKVYNNSKGRETRGGSDSKVYLYTLDPGAEDFERTELKLDGQYIEGISMVPGRDGKPAIAGVYVEKLGRRIKGYFSLDNPESGAVLKPQEFSQEVLEALGKRVTTRKGGELVMEGQFEFRDALRGTDGRLTILLEGYTERVSNNGPGAVGVGVGGFGYGRQRITYNYGEGVMLTFDQEGVLAEAITIPKFQSTEQANAPFYRMNLIEYDGQPAVIYNDNPKNFGRDLDKRTRSLRFQQAVATVSYAGRNGRLERRPLFARKDADKVVLVPASAERLANGEVVFLALRYRGLAKNELRFGLLSG